MTALRNSPQIQFVYSVGLKNINDVSIYVT